MTGRDLGVCPGWEELERLAAGADVDGHVTSHVEACPSCAEQLSQIMQENELLAEFAGAGAEGSGPDRDAASLDVPDGYEIVREIQRGAQGVVYEARQAATKRTVALKVLLHGAWATARQRFRFERELELVASLRHPGIVTVYGGGVTPGGRPFLAMEYVEGMPLDEHVRAVRGSAEDERAEIRRLLHVFARIGDAVAAAHRRGIIHRDLKPANILVDAGGQPRVLDFGLAKAMDPETDDDAGLTTVAGEFLGTFAYASPEQVAADPALVDTGSDVYALGVMLYEMLTGQRPYRLGGSVKQVVDAITSEEPARPGTVRPGLERDLDVIALTALAKEPERRYQSVAALVDDVRRFLAGAPIAARADDAWYVLRKTVRRYRVPVTLVTAAVLMLAASTVTMWRLKVRETEARREAIVNLSLALQTIGALDAENPERAVPVGTLAALLAEVSRFVEEELADAPDEAAKVRTALGLAYMSQAQFADAETHFTAALALRRERADGPSADIAESLHNLGRLNWKVGRFDEAERLYRAALDMRLATQGPEDPATARTMQHLASTYQRQGRLQESEELHRAALALRRRLLGDDHHDVAISLNALGQCLRLQARHQDAVEAFRAAHDIVAAMPPPNWQLPRAMDDLGSGLVDLGAYDEAERYLRGALARKRQSVGEDDPDVARTLHRLAGLHLARGELDEAEAACRRALEILEKRLPASHPDRADSLERLGRILLAAGRADEARTQFRKVIELRRETLGPAHWKTVEAERLLERADG